MIPGLFKGIVVLSDHQALWAATAEMLCQRLHQACGTHLIDIQHVGSTSVPGLKAKPIIDLAACYADDAAFDAMLPRIEALGYLYRGDKKETGGRLFVWETEPQYRSAHLHCIRKGSVQWTWYLGFRDALRSNPETRAAYEALKVDLLTRFRNDRMSYTEGKHAFIRSVLES